MSHRCPHGMLGRLCVVESCSHYDGGGSINGNATERRANSLSGRTIGKLTVLRRDRKTRHLWHCRCECGAEVRCLSSALVRAEREGHVKSCDGCRERGGK